MLVGTGLAKSRSRWVALAITATGLSGCMDSALNIQSTMGPGFAVSPETTGSTPRPQAEIAYSGDDLSDIPTDPTPVTALVGSQPEAPAVAVPATTYTLATVDGSTVRTLPAAGADEIDAPTARIYGAAPAQDFGAARPPMGTAPTKRSNGLLALFSGRRASSAREAVSPPAPVEGVARTAELWSAPPEPAKASALASGATALPGVDRDRTLGLDSRPDRATKDGVQLASAAGLARLAPHGLQVQRESVDVACLKPALVRVLKTVEQHFGRSVVVTSGFRDPSRNKQARGAENSLHMYCAAADIQVEGVSKVELASYLRSMPGRGGVGTYCYTQSVHVDVGPQRDWSSRCRNEK